MKRNCPAVSRIALFPLGFVISIPSIFRKEAPDVIDPVSFLANVIREQGIRIARQVELSTLDLAAVLFLCAVVLSLRAHVWVLTLAVCVLSVLWERWRRKILERVTEAESELWRASVFDEKS
jgi:hypothetical protein